MCHTPSVSYVREAGHLKAAAQRMAPSGDGTGIAPRVCRGSEVPRDRIFTTGCPVLNETLSGGIPARRVTEIVGESNCGKTQVCLQLLLAAQWPREHGGMGGRSLYIHTEGDGEVCMKRLKDLAEFHASKGLVPPSALDAIFMEKHEGSAAESMHATLVRAKGLVERFQGSGMPLKLIVIDSIANVFKEDDAKDGAGDDEDFLSAARTRSRQQYRIVQLLKGYAEQYDLSVVLTNHVVDCVGGENAWHEMQRLSCGGDLVSSDRSVLPSMGLTWSHLVDCRHFVSRTTRKLDQSKYNTSGVVRKWRVLFSPTQKPRQCMYIINQLGVWGLPESCLEFEDTQSQPQHDDEDLAPA